MTFTEFSQTFPTWVTITTVIVVIICLICQGIWLFRNAQKRRIFPWLWGLYGLISFPCPLLFYYVFVILPEKRRNESDDQE